jgi:hypothetical protein
MKRTLAGLLAAAMTLVAGDVTGTWSGSVKTQREDGTTNEDTAHFVLKQEGAAVSGTVGPNASDQRPISSGKLEGDNLTFEVIVEQSVFKAAFRLSGDTLSGEVRRERGDGQVRSARLELKRVAAAN